MRKSRDLELGPFLNSLSVIVPSYQRDYVWGDVQIYDLLKEIDYIFDSKKDKKDKLKIDKEELIKVLFSDGIEKMLDILEKKVKTAYKKGYKKGQKHTSYEDGYKDGEAKGFGDGYSDSNTRYT